MCALDKTCNIDYIIITPERRRPDGETKKGAKTMSLLTKTMEHNFRDYAVLRAKCAAALASAALEEYTERGAANFTGWGKVTDANKKEVAMLRLLALYTPRAWDGKPHAIPFASMLSDTCADGMFVAKRLGNLTLNGINLNGVLNITRDDGAYLWGTLGAVDPQYRPDYIAFDGVVMASDRRRVGTLKEAIESD